MFETGGMELIAIIAIVILLGVGIVIAAFASYRKRRKLKELGSSEEFSAVYDSVEPRKGSNWEDDETS